MTPEVQNLIAQGKAVDEQLKKVLQEAELLAEQKRAIFRELNKEHGMTIRELAAQFSIHFTRVSHIINGRKLCKPHHTANCKRCAGKQAQSQLAVAEDQMYALHTGDHLPRMEKL